MTDFQPLLNLFNDWLRQYCDVVSSARPSELYKPEAYILSLGGKRIRPILTLTACKLFGEDPARALNAALAIEIFHNFSLIHDDILDKAPLRRNKPTVHEKWNTNIAILSGDAMLVKAFSVLSDYPAELHYTLCKLLQETALKVCEGQQLDMNFEFSDTVSVNDYLEMITGKTAVLLGCSLQMGALIAGADKKSMNSIYEFGKNLGIAFQLNDDLLDAYSDSPDFGKQKGGDIIANKKTWLLLTALEKGDESDRKEIFSILGDTDPEMKVSRMLSKYDKLDIRKLCMDEADRYTTVALKSLSEIIADNETQKLLHDFAVTLLKRKI